MAAFFLKKGGVFLKTAQYLSTVSNLFDAEFTEVFSQVPDRAPARSYKEIRYRFLNEFHADPEDFFSEFDRRPLASASLGQVHVGRLHDGRKVAIKLLHPNIENQLRQDLRALRYVVRAIRLFYSQLDFRSHLQEFSNIVTMEIDYRNEKENLRRARDNWQDSDSVIVPQVVEEFSRSTVITTEYIQGISLNDTALLKRSNIDRRKVVEIIVSAYVKMVFEHRFFHADPHPGNIFVIEPTALHPLRVAFIDFGATQDVTESTLIAIRRFIELLRSHDIPALVELARETGLLDSRADREKYIGLCEAIHARYGSFKVEDYYRINPLRFGRIIRMRDLTLYNLQLRKVISEMRIPRKYIYLGRTLTLLLSVSHNLDENLNIFIMARPYVDHHIRQSFSISNVWRYRNWQKLLQQVGAALPRNSSWQPPKEREEREPAILYYQLGQQALFASLGLFFTLLSIHLNERSLLELSRWSLYAASANFALFVYRLFVSPRPR